MQSHSMITTKVVQLLKHLSATDLARLEKFVLSPYHNQHPEVTRLFQYFQHVDWHNEYMLSRGAVFQFIFPNQPYDDQKLRHITSYLMRVAEAFLVIEEMRTLPMEHNLQLQAAYQRRKLENLYLSNYKLMLKRQELRPLRDREYFEVDVRMFQNHYRSTADKSAQGYHTLALLSQATDRLFIVRKLQQAGRILAHQQMHEREIPIGLLEEALAYIAANDLEKVPAIAIHLNAYRILADREAEAAFHQLKVQLKEYANMFRREEIRDLLLTAVNFGAMQINQGKNEYLREVFELYRGSLPDKILFENEQFSPYAYKNIVASALKLKEFNWAQDFIDNYKKHLPELEKDDFHAYASAKLHFARGEWKAVINLLQKRYIKDSYTHLDARVTVLKALYEMGDFETLSQQLNILTQFLGRKEVDTFLRNNYSNFKTLLQKLTQIQPGDLAAKKDLESEVENTEVLSERNWLLEKMGQG